MPTDQIIDEIQINENDRTHVGQVLRSGTWWSADLLRLIAKSDPRRRAALRRAFPSFVQAYEKWCADPAEGVRDDE